MGRLRALRKAAPFGITERQLPTLPNRALDVLRLANDPDTSMVDLERVISREQTMTLRVLKVANSARYGRSREVDTIRHAVMLLGRTMIQELASALALAPTLSQAAEGLVDGPQLWDHSVNTALWCREVSRLASRPMGGQVFTGALMHDIGIVLLVRCAPESARSVLQLARLERMPIHMAERELLDTDHAEVAAAVCEAWGLPERLAELIRHHHDDDRDDGVATIAVAEHLARITGAAEFAWHGEREVPHTALAHLGLDAATIETLLLKRDEIREDARLLIE